MNLKTAVIAPLMLRYALLYKAFSTNGVGRQFSNRSFLLNSPRSGRIEGFESVNCYTEKDRARPGLDDGCLPRESEVVTKAGCPCVNIRAVNIVAGEVHASTNCFVELITCAETQVEVRTVEFSRNG